MNASRIAERGASYALQTALEPTFGTSFDLLATAPQGVAKLRELILSLAVHGKLVQQQASEEPAIEILSRLDKEKQTRPKGRSNKRATARAVCPFDIPNSWIWVGLSDVTYSHGQETPSSAFSYIDVASIDNERGCVKDDVQVISASDAPSRARKVVKKGTVIYSTIRPYLKNIAIIEKDYSPAPIASTAFAIMQPRAGLLLPKFLFFYLRSAQFTEFVASRMLGVAYPAINDANFFEGMLPLPPLAEQARIVARVEELMQLCDTLEAHGRLQDEQHARLVATLFDALAASASAEELAENWQRIATHFDLLLDRPEAVDALEQTLLQLAVRGLLVPQDPADEPASELLARIRAEKDQLVAAGRIKRDKLAEVGDEEKELAELPPGWEWASVATIAIVGTGTTPSRTNPAYFSPAAIPWVTSGETGQPFITKTEQAVSSLALKETSLAVYPSGTLIVAMYGQGKTRGQVSELLIEATTNQACAAIVPVVPDPEHRRYLKLFFEKIYDEIRELSAGGAQPNLNVGKVKATLISLPPLAEQHRIVARVEQLRRLCAELRGRLQQACVTQSRLADALVSAADQSSAC